MDHFDEESRKNGLYERRMSLPRAIQLDLSQTTTHYTQSSSYDPDDEVFIEFEEWQQSESCISQNTMDGICEGRTRRTSDVIDSLGPETAWTEPGPPRMRRTTSPDLRHALHVFTTSDSTAQLTPRSDRGYWSGSVTSASSPLEPKWFRFSQSSDRRSTMSEGDDPVNITQSLASLTIGRTEEHVFTDPLVNQRKPDTVDAKPIIGQHQPYISIPGRNEVKEAIAPVSADSFEYNMCHPKRGVAVILNHETFRTNTLTPRIGSKCDVACLTTLYETLGFEVRLFEDLTCQQIYNTLEQISQEDHSNRDCICVTVLTHGLDGQHLYAYDTPYPYDDLYTHFTGPKCLSLAGKPKIFIIQACRGTKLDSGVRMVSWTTTDSAAATFYSIPSMSDFLIANSTFSGFFSWRNPEEGTWYIQSLVKIMTKFHQQCDLVTMMTRAACLVATCYESSDDSRPDLSGMKQSPSLISTLIRQIYFRPKIQIQ